MKTSRGYSLVEVVIVLLLLGALGAAFVPRMIRVDANARAAALQGLAGSMRSAVTLIQSKSFVSGIGAPGTVPLSDGTTVAVTNKGYPLASVAGIDRAAGISPLHYTCTGSPIRTCRLIDGPAGCFITYDQATGQVDDSNAAVILQQPAKGKGKGKGPIVSAGC